MNVDEALMNEFEKWMNKKYDIKNYKYKKEGTGFFINFIIEKVTTLEKSLALHTRDAVNKLKQIAISRSENYKLKERLANYETTILKRLSKYKIYWSENGAYNEFRKFIKSVEGK